MKVLLQSEKQRVLQRVSVVLQRGNARLIGLRADCVHGLGQLGRLAARRLALLEGARKLGAACAGCGPEEEKSGASRLPRFLGVFPVRDVWSVKRQAVDVRRDEMCVHGVDSEMVRVFRDTSSDDFLRKAGAKNHVRTHAQGPQTDAERPIPKTVDTAHTGLHVKLRRDTAGSCRAHSPALLFMLFMMFMQ